MKIIHILNEFREFGNGIVNVACDLACLQAKLGHNVTVISGGGEYESLLTKFGGKHIILDQSRSVNNLIPMFFQFNKIISRINPDIVHAHMMTGTILGNLIFNRKFKLITTVHNEYQKSSFIMRYANATVAVSEAVRNAMLKKGCSPSKSVTIINGTLGSPRRNNINSITPYQLKTPSLITLGAVSKRKGSDILLNAFLSIADKYPSLNLYYIGNKDWEQVINKAKDSSFSDRIHFLGFESQPLKYLLSADIFVFPSLREPLGLAILEAREAGLPIIASNADGIPEALEYGKAGILFKTGDTDDLVAKIEYLLNDSQARKEFSIKAMENIQLFSVERMTTEYLEIYEQVLSKG